MIVLVLPDVGVVFSAGEALQAGWEHPVSVGTLQNSVFILLQAGVLREFCPTERCPARCLVLAPSSYAEG